MTCFLTIGRVLYDKGFNELIECSSYFKSRNQDVEFQWLGPIDTGYSQFISEDAVNLYHERNIIKYLGSHLDVRCYIKDADCIVLPSYHEGMSRVLMEGIAMGKPIITSNIPGCREAVINGKNGFLCEPKNSQSLIDAVNKFLSLTINERKMFGESSRELAESRFDIKHVISLYDNVVSEILIN